jgi:type I restriction enzyme S subunit
VGWKVEYGKWLFKKKDRKIRKSDETITCFRDGQVTLRKNRRVEGFTNAIKEHGYQGVRKGDLVIHAMDAFAGAIGVSDSDGKSTPVYAVCTPQKINSVNQYYYAYFLRSLALNGFIKCLAKGIRERSTDFRFNDFRELILPYPPLEEQTAIANFLDEKCSKIDRAVAQKKKLVALLKERKQIVIQNAVTKGLNPNAKMKDSGVDWIGEIPEGWEVIKIKYAASIFRGKFTHRPRNDARLYDGKYPFFQTGDIAKAEKYLLKYKQTLNERGLKVSTLIPKGTVVITIAANIGDVSILDIDACFPDSVVGFKPQKKYNRDYLYYKLKSMKEKFIGSTVKNTQMNLNVERIGSNFITCPPKFEQKTIVAHIETQSQKINKAITLQQNQIEKLKEYKSILINNAVTGKIKVC